MKGFETLVEALSDLKSSGYTHDFVLKEEGLYCPDLHQTFVPGQLQVREYYRFEGPSYPGDNDILYAIETKDAAVRGTLVCPYGAYFDPATAKLLMSIDLAAETIA